MGGDLESPLGQRIIDSRAARVGWWRCRGGELGQIASRGCRVQAVVNFAQDSLPVIPAEQAAAATRAVCAQARQVTLVRPALVSSAGTWSSPITPPLGPAYLAAVLIKDGHRVECVDAVGEGVDQILREGNFVYQGLTIEETVDRIQPGAEVIGVSCMFSQDWPFCRRLITRIRERFPQSLLIAGGEHVTALPDYSLRDCPAIDVCVLGEGEETISELVTSFGSAKGWEEVAGVAYLKAGRYVRTQPRQRIRHVEEIPYPAWDLFPMQVYLDTHNGHGVYLGRTVGILATRGCPYQCTFCSNPEMYGKAYIARKPADVLDEIEHWMQKYDAENFDFYDLTMILKKSWILEFCQEIERRGLRFTWQLPTGTRSEVVDDDVAPWLYRTGCRNITYAPESGDPITLDKIKKRVHLPDLMHSIDASLRAGIHVKCNIVVGFPHEQRRNVWRTMVFCWRLALRGVHDVGIFLFSAYPGSQLFHELQSDGIIPQDLDDEYFDALVNFMDPTSTAAFCRAVSGRELAVWRLFGMATFFGLSYAVRPWRFFKFLRNVWNYQGDTVLEQRVGALVDRWRHIQKVASTAPASSALTFSSVSPRTSVGRG